MENSLSLSLKMEKQWQAIAKHVREDGSRGHTLQIVINFTGEKRGRAFSNLTR